MEFRPRNMVLETLNELDQFLDQLPSGTTCNLLDEFIENGRFMFAMFRLPSGEKFEVRYLGPIRRRPRPKGGQS